MTTEKAKLSLDAREFMRGLKSAISGTDDLTDSLEEATDAAGGTGKALDGVGDKGKKTGGSVGALGGQLGKLAGTFAKALGPIAAVGGAFLGVATAAFSMASEAADSADSIAKLALVTGESADALSRYQQLAEKTLPSGSIDKLAEGFQKLNSEGGAKVLAEIGVAGDSASESFANLADWYKETGNTAERSAKLTKLLGDGLARELAPALDLGAEGIENLLTQNDEFNRSLSSETLANVGLYKDAQQELGGATKGLGNEFLSLTPIMTFSFQVMTAGVQAAADIVKGIKAAGEGMSFFASTLGEWVGSSKSWNEAADQVALGLAADAQATEEGRRQTEEDIKAKNKAARAASEQAAALVKGSKDRAEALRVAAAANAAYVKELFAEQGAAMEAAKAADALGAALAKSLPAVSAIGAGLSSASDGAYALLPPLEDLGGQLANVDASGLDAANALSSVKDVAKEAWAQIRELTKALLETAFAFASLATDTGLKALQFDIGGILDTFAQAIPAAIEKIRNFGAKAYEVMGRLFENMPEWIGEAGAAVGAALAVIGGAAAAAIKIVSGVVNAVNTLLKQFAGVDIVGLLTGDMDPAAIFAQAEQALSKLVTSLPSRIVEVFSGGALGEFFSMALDQLVGILPEALPAVVGFLTQAAGDLVKALPAILKAVISSDLGGLIKDVLVSLAAQLPVLIPQIITLGTQIMVGVVEALPSLIVGIVKALPQIAVGLIQAIGALFLGLIAGILEAIGLDKAAEKVSGTIDASFSDTPGLMRAGSGGSIVRVAPFDFFKAAKAPDTAGSFSDSRMVRELELGRAEAARGNQAMYTLVSLLRGGGGAPGSINMRPI